MQNIVKMNDRVKIGVEIGEHINDFDNYIQYINKNYDLSKLDFVLIMMKPVKVRENLWNKWARFFKDKQIYFAFLYTQQRGAPKGKVSHLSNGIVADLKKLAGKYFLGDMIGETGGLSSWLEGYYDDKNMEKPSYENFCEAKQDYVNHVASKVNIDKNLNVPAVLAVEATMFNRYNFEAGVDNTAAEMMCTNPELMLASARGASGAYKKDWWASHIANEWYGGFRNDDVLKYKRLKLAYYYAFLSGAEYIYPESGNMLISSYGYNYDAKSEFCKKYRSVWNEFSDYVHLHKRFKGGPEVKVAFLQGNLDSYTGWGGSTIWNKFGDENWTYGPAERSWEIIDNIMKGEKWHNPQVYGETDYSSSPPYGQYDIVPTEAPLDILQNYNYLIFVGWNTMTEEIYKKLKDYVYNGGKLLASIPHLNTKDIKGEQYELYNNGDFSDLFGCIVKGPGENLNWGVKFINESMVEDCLYPYTKDGICDPICADGAIRSADVKMAGGNVTALLSDKFLNWRDNSPPVLIENAYGKGFATLLSAYDYPGAKSIKNLFNIILKAILKSEQEKADINVVCNDKIYYSVYCKDDVKTVYLLNSDYNNPNIYSIRYNNMEITKKIESCEINTAYVTPWFICIPENKETAIDEFNITEKEIQLAVKGKYKKQINWVFSEKKKKITVNGKPLDF